MTTDRLLGAAFAALLSAAPAAAQGTLSFGETVAGELTPADPTLGDGNHFDVWRFEGTEGRRITVVLRSDEFDTVLSVGSTADEECEDCLVDDDGAGGTDSRVMMTLRRSGPYAIRAGSAGAGETGAYTLALEDRGPAPPLVARGEIRAGETISGTLDETDSTSDDGRYVELWEYRGAPDYDAVIYLRSDDFDAFLRWGRIVDGTWEPVEEDDDGAYDGTNSRLRVRPGDDGVYHIEAGSLFAGETGSYTLTVERR